MFKVLGNTEHLYGKPIPNLGFPNLRRISADRSTDGAFFMKEDPDVLQRWLNLVSQLVDESLTLPSECVGGNSPPISPIPIYPSLLQVGDLPLKEPSAGGADHLFQKRTGINSNALIAM